MLIACGGDGSSGSDGGVDTTVDPGSPELVGLVPTTLASALISSKGSPPTVFIDRSDGDWVEVSDPDNGEVTFKFIGSAFDVSSPPICVITATRGQSDRFAACQITTPVDSVGFGVECWDTEIDMQLDNAFAVMCIGKAMGTGNTVHPAYTPGLRFGASELTISGGLGTGAEIGDFVSAVTTQGSNLHATFEAGVFQDTPTCIANGASKRLAIEEMSAGSADFRLDAGIPRVDLLCTGEAAVPNVVESTSTHGALVVGANIVGTNVFQFGTWVSSVARPSIGTAILTVVPQTFDRTPICACSTVGAFSDRHSCTVVTTSEDQIEIAAATPTGAIDTDLEVICAAERP